MKKGMKFLFILISVLLISLGAANGQATPVATVTPQPTPMCDGMLIGKVTDAITKAAVVGAVVTAKPGGLTTTTDSSGNYVLLDIPEGEYTIRVTAEGYVPAEKEVSIDYCSFTIVNFELQPIVTPGTPTPMSTSIGVCIKPDAIEVSQDKLRLRKRESSEIAVTVTCTDGSPLEGEEVMAVVKGKSRRVVRVTQRVVTDASGTAVFRVNAKSRLGRAMVEFRVDGKRKIVKVFVRK